MLLQISGTVKEFLTLAIIVGVVVYFVCQPSTVPQLEQSEKARSQEHASMRNPPRPASTATAAADGSMTNRWETGPSAQTTTPGPSDGNSLADRWKPRP